MHLFDIKLDIDAWIYIFLDFVQISIRMYYLFWLSWCDSQLDHHWFRLWLVSYSIQHNPLITFPKMFVENMPLLICVGEVWDMFWGFKVSSVSCIHDNLSINLSCWMCNDGILYRNSTVQNYDLKQCWFAVLSEYMQMKLIWILSQLMFVVPKTSGISRHLWSLLFIIWLQS